MLTIGTFIVRLIWQPHPNGYWIPMTAAVVLKADFQTTYVRGIARLAGTVVGAAGATLLMSLFRPTPPLLAVLILACLWVCFTHQRVNYGLFATFITAYVVLLLALGGLPEPAVALRRTLATLIGGALSLGSYLFVAPGRGDGIPALARPGPADTRSCGLMAETGRASVANSDQSNLPNAPEFIRFVPFATSRSALQFRGRRG